MAQHSASEAKGDRARALPVLDADILDDLKRKQELLSAACRCLNDHRSYLFFDRMAALARQASHKKEQFLNSLETLGAYEAYELATIRRLVMEGGAIAFKELVDQVRGIRVQQEIETMVR